MEKGGEHWNEMKREKGDQRWKDKRGDETAIWENGLLRENRIGSGREGR